MRAGVWRAALIICSSVTACGRIGFDPLADDATSVDAPALPAGPFGTPIPLTDINSATTDVDPSMTADGLLLFFCSLRSGSLDIHFSQRATIESPWEPPTRVADGISTAAIEQDPVISADGLSLYFTRSGEIQVAVRSSRDDAFGTPTPIAELNVPGEADVVSSVTPDGLAMTLHSTRPGSQGSDIYLATRATQLAPWVVEAVMGNVNGPDTEADSFLWSDRLTLFFDSDRGGTFDLYVSTRASTAEPFGPPVPVSELNTGEEDADLWLTGDGRTGLFVRGPSLVGNLDIYEVRR